MIEKLKLAAVAVIAVLGLVAPVAITSSAVQAACTTPKDCVKEGADKADTGGPSDLPAFITNLVRVMLFIVGTISVVMIIYGGIKYSISAGDSSKITTAKNTIMYSVIGLVVSILAYAIISFVVANVK
jgi:hypothetical protein